MLSKWWYTFNNSNSSRYRFLRTLVQAIVAAVIVAVLQVVTAWVPEFVGTLNLSPEMSAMVTGAIMSILATVQSQYGKRLSDPEGD